MSGRCEHDKKIEENVYRKLGNAPAILVRYYQESAGSQQTSKNNYINLMKRFVTFLMDETEDIDPYIDYCWSLVKKRHVKDFILKVRTRTLSDGTEKPLRAKTLKDYSIALNNFFQFLIDEEIISKNPMPSSRELKNLFPQEMTEHKAVALEPDEVTQFADYIRQTSNTPDVDVAVFLLGCRTGLRATALSQIDVSDINFEKKELYVIEKNNKFRTVFLDDKSLDMIRDLIDKRSADAKDMEPLFLSRTKGKWHRMPANHISYLIQKAEKAYEGLGKHITPHKMRSTCITNTYDMTHDIYKTAKKAGHNDVSTTLLYISSEKYDREVSNGLAERY